MGFDCSMFLHNIVYISAYHIFQSQESMNITELKETMNLTEQQNKNQQYCQNLIRNLTNENRIIDPSHLDLAKEHISKQIGKSIFLLKFFSLDGDNLKVI